MIQIGRLALSWAIPNLFSASFSSVYLSSAGDGFEAARERRAGNQPRLICIGGPPLRVLWVDLGVLIGLTWLEVF